METSNKELDKAFHEILDCFSGADGGASFVDLQNLIICMQKRSEQGDEAARKIIQFVMQFARLIKVASEESKNR